MSPEQNARRAILIAGMHRSGTSALARVVNLLGAEIGTDLLPRRVDNPTGHWESADVVALNDACLRHFGLNWHDPQPLPDGWLDAPWMQDWRARVSALVQARFASASLFVVKDPRLARLLPAWLQVLRGLDIEPGVIISLRHPDEVAASLTRRGAEPIPAATSYALWLSHLLDAEVASRETPRSVVRYEDVLEDWRACARSMADDLDIQWPVALDAATTDIASFLDSRLRHHRSRQHLANRRTALATRMTSIYTRIGDSGIDERRDREWLDQIRQAWRGDMDMMSELRGISNAAMRELSAPVGTSMRSDGRLWEPSEIKQTNSHLYFRASREEYDESRMVEAEVRSAREPSKLHFELPSGAHPDFIRVDPAPLPGYYRIIRIAINECTLTRSQTHLSGAHQKVLEPMDGELLRFYCSDDDPWFELDLRKTEYPTRATPLSFEYQIERDSLPDMLDRLHHVVARTLTGGQRESHDRYAKLAQHIEDIRAGQYAAAAQVDRVTSEIKNEVTDASVIVAFHALPANALRTSPMRGSVQLALRAAHQLRQLAQRPRSTAKLWCSEGSDPHFAMTWTGNQPIAAGWYALAMDAFALRGALVAPRVYPDYGDGFVEADGIALAWSPSEYHQRPLVHYTRPVRALRLDPCCTEGRCDFVTSPPTLQRITTLGALLRLGVAAVQRMHMQGAGIRAISREVLAILRNGGIGASVATLHSNHQVAVATNAGMDYDTWVATVDKLNQDDRNRITTEVAQISDPPLISILLPVFNTPEKWLRRCLDSVLQQLYPYWELCIADDASTDAKVRTVLEEYAARDERIKITWRGANGHISAASNSALELAKGSYVALLDHDDELAPHALYHVAKKTIADPGLKLLYSDEDKLDANNRRVDPYFKPDWNPELFRSQNFICHLGTYSTELVRQLGGFREGFEGSQDHDLALRCIEQLAAEQIGHIPHVLYHWRAVAGSTARSSAEKSYTQDAALKAVKDHLERSGFEHAKVLRTDAGYLRVRYPLPPVAPLVSIIIPTRDRVDLLETSVESILGVTDYPNYEVIVVDNQSRAPETMRWFDQISARDNRVRVLKHDLPFNFSRINNSAVENATGDLIALVNNDVEVVHSDWLSEMVSHAVHDDVGAVGAKLYYPDGSIQHAGVILGFGGVAGHAYCQMPHEYPGQMGRAHLAQSIGAVTAACLLVHRCKYLEVGGMNEDLQVAFNDIDFCLRLSRAGYRNVWTPYAELIHYESSSRGYEDSPEKQARFNREIQLMRRLWGDTLLNDPAYNPNLSLDAHPFHLADPPRVRT